MAHGERNRVLANAVRAGREELADREPDDIPHRLRRVARSTGRGLPKPLERTLIDFMENDDAFRSAVAERFDSMGIDDELVATFLRDPSDAAPLIEERVAAANADDTDARLAALEDARADLETQLATAKDRLLAERATHESDLAEQSAAARRAREGLERQLFEARAHVAETEAANQALMAEVQSLTAELEEVRDRLMRRDERDSRRRDSLKKDRSGGQTESLPTDPILLARYLDELERQLHFYRDPDRRADIEPDDGLPFALPAGISSEASEAVDWVLANGAETVLVDGYNVAGVVSGDSIGRRESRDEAIQRAEAIKRSAPRSEVIVVFDAADAGGRGGFRSRDGVLVEFEPSTTADDAIVDYVQGGTERCVVFTNDRELQHRSTRDGCVVLYATALVSWTEHLNG